MSVNDVNNTTSILDQYRTPTQTQAKDNELDKTAFLELMVAQLNNQNPLEPTDNQAFVAQLAQFSSVEGLDNLNSTAEGIAGQFTSNAALQASSLVGQSVIVDGNTSGVLTNGGIVSGYTELETTATGVSLAIEDSSGQLLEQIPLGNRPAGPMSVRWDGYNLMVDGEIVDIDRSQLNLEQYYRDESGELVLDDDGNPIERAYAPGEYVFKLNGSVAGEAEQFDMQMSARVDSVTMSATGSVTLNLTGGQRATMDQIQQILDV
ncbi:MAG: flagellar hook assembly protein FlgD [Pseudomonadota bacterium]|jgi:flagellar basal-body rod modification protein FlgD|nr:flagellar hook assembly protein FlgD [Pseudomonadota bacterium]